MKIQMLDDKSSDGLITSFDRLTLGGIRADKLKQLKAEIERLFIDKVIKPVRFVQRGPKNSQQSQGWCKPNCYNRDGTTFINVYNTSFPLKAYFTDDDILNLAHTPEFYQFLEQQMKQAESETVSKCEVRRASSDSGYRSENSPNPELKDSKEVVRNSLDERIKRVRLIEALRLKLDELFSIDSSDLSVLHKALARCEDCKECFYCLFERMKKYPDRFHSFFTQQMKDSIGDALKCRGHRDLLNYFEESFAMF